VGGADDPVGGPLRDPDTSYATADAAARTTDAQMSTSSAGIDFIKNYEKLELTAYTGADSGNSTIGYGHVIVSGEIFRTITPQQAESILARDLHTFERAINRVLNIMVSKPQFDALVSLAFNAGPGNTRSIVEKINKLQSVTQRDFEAFRFSRDKHGTKIEPPGLIKRRRDEFRIFSSGFYRRTP
jgi:lysozyme